jgi:hypothetical protein
MAEFQFGRMGKVLELDDNMNVLKVTELSLKMVIMANSLYIYNYSRNKNMSTIITIVASICL